VEIQDNKNRDVLKDAENIIRPNSRDIHFTHASIENLFENFCNATYFRASFFSSAAERAQAKELAQPYFDKLVSDEEFGELFISIFTYYDRLANLRARLLEYRSIPKISFHNRNLHKDFMIGWIKDLESRSLEIESIMSRRGLEQDAPILINNLKILADKWEPERYYTSAEGGTWKDYWKSITSLNPTYAFVPKRPKK
jgi:hypothetical protein